MKKDGNSVSRLPVSQLHVAVDTNSVFLEILSLDQISTAAVISCQTRGCSYLEGEMRFCGVSSYPGDGLFVTDGALGDLRAFCCRGGDVASR